MSKLQRGLYTLKGGRGGGPSIKHFLRYRSRYQTMFFDPPKLLLISLNVKQNEKGHKMEILILKS